MLLKFFLVFLSCSTVVPSDSVRLNRKIKHQNMEDLKSVDKMIARNKFSTAQQCIRRCRKNVTKNCYYRFHVEQYSISGRACEICTPNRGRHCQCVITDDHERNAYTVNRQIPGPTIEVCKGDTVYVDVVNLTPESAITIHWHGILQFNTSYYDGVPFVTQCPILPGNTFRYVWHAKNSGTHFWHSHVGLQKVDGLSGAIIIRKPREEDEHFKFYDEDLSKHVIFLQDWFFYYMDRQFPGNRFADRGQHPYTLLINGKGKFENSTKHRYENVAVFEVSARRRYRFRYISAATSICPIQLFIENHPMVVIAVDGNPIQPIKVDSIISGSAERFDFVISTYEIRGSFWMYAKALVCGKVQPDQIAILRYRGFPLKPQSSEPSYDKPLESKKVLNPLDTDCSRERDDAICISQLNFTKTMSFLRKQPIKIYMSFRLNFSRTDEFKPNIYQKHFIAPAGFVGVGMINNITYQAPPSPLISQYNDLDNRHFCNVDNLTNECTHLIDIPLNSVVELVLLDEAQLRNMHHPFHLHGFRFHVISMKAVGRSKANMKEIMKMDREGKIKRRLDGRPPLKDTIMIPNDGYVVLRFLADNPGFWLIHCHILTHLVTGMEAVVKVGSIDQMQKVPGDFPKCGHYLPETDL